MIAMRMMTVVAVLVLSGCANNGPVLTSTSTSSDPAAPTGRETPQIVKSQDGSYTGEVIGTAQPGSKFATLKIGMSMADVQNRLDRAPDRSHTYESGKRWIPFYFGNDARRLQVLYKGEGCLIFTNGNVWGGSGGDLIQIQHDSSGKCYQP